MSYIFFVWFKSQFHVILHNSLWLQGDSKTINNKLWIDCWLCEQFVITLKILAYMHQFLQAKVNDVIVNSILSILPYPTQFFSRFTLDDPKHFYSDRREEILFNLKTFYLWFISKAQQVITWNGPKSFVKWYTSLQVYVCIKSVS